MGIPMTEKQIMDKYPSLFIEKDLPMTHTCMCWGLSFDDGWYEIFDQMCAEIMATNEHCVFTQTKEKFGGLRVYANCSDNVQKIIDKYEDLSYKTCEICGKSAKVCNRGCWLKTLCEECMTKNDYVVYDEKNDF